MLDFLKNIDFSKPANVAKVAGLAALGIVVLIFVVSLLGSSYRSLTREGGTSVSMPEMMGYDGGSSPVFSMRNVMPVPPMPGGTSGADAEEYEVSDYTASIETRDLTEACVTMRKLKTFDYVIFESASESDTACSFTFKVLRAHVEEVLAYVTALDPKDLSESTYTIKREIEDYTSAVEILTKKLKVIDDTLSGALDAYDDVTALAIRTEDVETLANIVSSRIGIIERLTQERLHVSAELERLARAKAIELDRLVYSRFSVSVYENKFLDGEALLDSWKAAVQKFVTDVNEALQNATVGLIGFLVALIPFILYLVLLIVAAKYGWKVAQYIWRR